MQIKKKLLDIVRDKIRVKHYSIKTEKSYVGFIKYHMSPYLTSITYINLL